MSNTRTNPGELLEQYGEIVMPAATILASQRLNVKLFDMVDRRFLAGHNEWIRAGVNVLGPSLLSVGIIALTNGDIARSAAVGGGIASLENAFSQIDQLPDPLDFAGEQSGVGVVADRTGGGLVSQTPQRKTSLEAGNGSSGLLGSGDGLAAASVSETTLDTDSSFL